MLPTVLKNLIAQYNEKGQFLLSSCKKNIYWFNGKRFELWYKTSEIIGGIYFDCTGKLFFTNENLNIFKNYFFLRNQRVKFVGQQKDLSLDHREIQVDSKTKYSYYYGTMYKNNVLISKRAFHLELHSNLGIFLFQDYIYFFSNWGFTIDKFSLKTNQWIAIFLNVQKNNPKIMNAQVCLCKDVFYIFAESSNQKQLNFCFDPVKNVFYDNKFILP